MDAQTRLQVQLSPLYKLLGEKQQDNVQKSLTNGQLTATEHWVLIGWLPSRWPWPNRSYLVSHISFLQH